MTIAVKLAVDLVEQESGKFEPEKMPNEYARAVQELVQAKIEERAPEVEIETEKRETPKVVNIMDALKKSMQAKGQTKVRGSVRKHTGKAAAKGQVSSRTATVTAFDAAYCSLAFTGTDKLPAHFSAEVASVLLISRLDYNARKTVEHTKARKLDFNLVRFAKVAGTSTESSMFCMAYITESVDGVPISFSYTITAKGRQFDLRSSSGTTPNSSR